jgi:hypothetical protein
MIDFKPNAQAFFTRNEKLGPHGLLVLQRMAEEIDRLRALTDAQAAQIAALDARVADLEP